MKMKNEEGRKSRRGRKRGRKKRMKNKTEKTGPRYMKYCKIKTKLDYVLIVLYTRSYYSVPHIA